MAIVDDRGRVAGRINVIDALVAAVVLLLIPVAYGAYLLFRTPVPKLTGVFPAKVYQGNNLRIEITGSNLRPFMRVAFNTIQGRTFMIGSTKYAQVDLPELAPGVYDVQLFDYMQEVDHIPKGLTVLPLAPVPTVTLEVSGFFTQLPDSMVAQIQPGLKFPPNGEPAGEVLAVRASTAGILRLRAGGITMGVPLDNQREIPATLRVKCSVSSNPDGSLHCTMPGPIQAAAVEPDSNLTLAGPQGWVNFQIDEVRVADTPAVATAQVRFVVSPEALGAMKAGDVDNSPNVLSQSRAAKLVAIGAARAIAAADAGMRPPIGGQLRAIDATLQVPVESTRGGWTYRSQTLKIGAPFTFETFTYVARGEIIALTPPQIAKGSGSH